MNYYNTPKARLENSLDIPAVAAPLVPRFLAGVLDMLLLLLVDAAVLAVLAWLYGETLVQQMYLFFNPTTVNSLLLILTVSAIGLCLGVVIYSLLNFALLVNGQTIGKRLFKLKIVSLIDEPLSWKDIVIKRFLPFWACLSVPYVGSILLFIDLLPCLTKRRRCLHDMIAKTRVISLKTEAT